MSKFKSISKYNDSKYDGLFSSPLLLAALEELTGSDILDEDSEAFKLWKKGGRELDLIAIVDQNREFLSDYEGEELCWGAGYLKI